MLNQNTINLYNLYLTVAYLFLTSISLFLITVIIISLMIP